MTEAPMASADSPNSLDRHIPAIAVEWAQKHPDRLWQRVEGTLCFADISGFTALAERLALRGRVGGEELVDTLGRVFGTMLDIVAERQGELLKFGGDALLLFFRGDGHVVNAASAAVEMRRALRKAADIPTSVGPLRLSMSVGLHAGPVHLFLVGESHRELVLLGPSVNAVVETEGAAQAGQILVSSETAALLPRKATRVVEGGLHQLRWQRAPGPAPGALARLEASAEQLRSLFPSTLGNYLAREVPEPEHRIACIAFAKFTGTDAILERDGPDALAEALHRTISLVEHCLNEEGVTLLAVDVDADGGKLFMGAGVPFGLEDDEGSMLQALKRILDADPPLPLQIGVNRGHVFAAELGAQHRSAYSAMGDTTNTAARIAGKAPLGQIYAHPEVLDECLMLYSTTPSEPLTMKGKAAPLVVYQVGEAQGLRQREGLMTGFFGRETELGLLAEVFASLHEGRGGMVCVTGESGLGKSRLLEESRTLAGRELQLFVRGEPYGANSAYRALRDPIRGLLGIERDTPAAMAAALERAVERIDPALLPMIGLLAAVLQIPVPESEVVQAIDAQFRPQRTAELVAELLEKTGESRKVFLIDDAHWVDDASAQLLTYLGTRTADLPWLLLVARRESDRGFAPAATTPITLAPLTKKDVRELVMSATEAAPLRPHELDQVIARTGGNPLFAMEIIKAVREIGSLDAVPLSLEAAMAAQVDALDRHNRRVLRYASVLGRSFSRNVLAEVLAGEGHGLTDAMLQMLKSFLEPDGPDRLRFRSGIVRDTVYESVSFRQRARLHLSAGETMERLVADPELAADSLALHFYRAGEQSRAWRYSNLAAQRARAAYANTEAAIYYRVALEAARSLTEIPAVELITAWRGLGEARERAGEFDSALEAFSAALRLATDDPLTIADLLLEKAVVKVRIGKPKAALSDLTRGRKALAGLEGHEAGRMRARTLAFRAIVHQGQGRLQRAMKAARAAESDARAAGDQSTLGQALNAIGLVTLMTEGPQDDHFFKDALTAARAADDLTMQAMVQSNLGVLYAMAGRWGEAVPLFREAAEASRQVGDEVGAATTAQNLGEMLVKQNRFDEAEGVLRDAVRVFQASGNQTGANPEVLLAQVLMNRGALDDAHELLSKDIATFRSTDQPLLALETAAVLTDCLLRMGEPQEGLNLLAQAAAEAGDDAEYVRPVTAIGRARALVALEDYDAAEAEITAGLAAAMENQLPYEEAMLRSVRMELAEQAGRTPEPEDSDAVRAIFDQLEIQPPT